ncbi:MAG: vanadium-dependent haloperoxidase [Pseudomonadota bacterium]
MTQDRRQAALAFRIEAANKAADRDHPAHEANGDEERYAGAHYAMSFTKGLAHNEKHGLCERAEDFLAFREAVDTGFIDAFTDEVPVPHEVVNEKKKAYRERRKWEAPTAGLVFELEGPDPQAVTMPPAPALALPETRDELGYEMAEVYELALLRDTPFTDFEGNAPGPAGVQAALDRLNAHQYTADGFPGRPRLTGGAANIVPQWAFRGASPGVGVGPYTSQFLLIGNADRAWIKKVEDGFINYGALAIDQRVILAKEGVDYMQDKANWLLIQNGFMPDVPKKPEQAFEKKRRFISTPRDLATYVHFDQLYEAYLNACLILLEMGAPFDPAFDALSGGTFNQNRNEGTGAYVDTMPRGAESIERKAGGFALYGGPHILTLVTEVATRALKAVRFQKFNTHIRLRPEALAGRIACLDEIAKCFPKLAEDLGDMAAGIQPSIDAIKAANPGGAAFLPMAFPEGSPMHPAYGAGHATVAGACVTILKAFFDTSAVFVKPAKSGGCEGHYVEGHTWEKGMPTWKRWTHGDTPCAFVSDYNVGSGKGEKLVDAGLEEGVCLTLEGELNKLAANISIGRNMAGVHYFTDYYDSLRMGEEIAIGMLEEQALGYRTDRFVMSIPTFDGEVRRIGAR